MSNYYFLSLSFASETSLFKQSASGSPPPPSSASPYSFSSRAATRSSSPSSSKPPSGKAPSPPPLAPAFPPSPCHGRAGVPEARSGAAAAGRALRIAGGWLIAAGRAGPGPWGRPYLSARAVKCSRGSPQPQQAEWLLITDWNQRCSRPVP